MSVSMKLSSEFVLSAKAVSEAPDNYSVKTETLSMLMQMKALAARGNAMAQYRLAQVYPKNSPTYLSLMEAAAKQGLTNAMLDLSVVYAKSGTVSGLRQSAVYLVKILNSKDSYIKSEATALIQNNRLLGAEVTRQLKSMSMAKSSVGFFAQESRVAEPKPSELIETIKP